MTTEPQEVRSMGMLGEWRKRQLAIVLFVVGAAAGVYGFVLWQDADDASTKDVFEHVTPDHSGAVVMLVAAAVALVCAAILYAGSRLND